MCFRGAAGDAAVKGRRKYLAAGDDLVLQFGPKQKTPAITIANPRINLDQSGSQGYVYAN